MYFVYRFLLAFVFLRLISRVIYVALFAVLLRSRRTCFALCLSRSRYTSRLVCCVRVALRVLFGALAPYLLCVVLVVFALHFALCLSRSRCTSRQIFSRRALPYRRISRAIVRYCRAIVHKFRVVSLFLLKIKNALGKPFQGRISRYHLDLYLN